MMSEDGGNIDVTAISLDHSRQNQVDQVIQFIHNETGDNGCQYTSSSPFHGANKPPGALGLAPFRGICGEYCRWGLAFQNQKLQQSLC